MSIEFHNPELLLLLLALPLLAFLKGKMGRRAALRYSSVALVARLARHSKSRPGALVSALRLLTLAALIIALARPQWAEGHTDIETSGIDIMLAIDVSASMRGLDFATQDDIVTRLDVVKRVVARFIKKRKNDRIGLIAFARQPYLVSPLTLNHEWLLGNLERMRLGIIDGRQTAIGTAIGMGANRLRNLEDAKSRVMVLLTDGEDNVNNIPPVAAAEAARAFDIKIYTVGAGVSGVVAAPRLDRSGQLLLTRDGKMIRGSDMRSNVDEETLKKIAEMTGGKFYRATRTRELERIYEEIDQLEKTEIKLRHYSTYTELFPWAAGLALMLGALELALATTRMSPAP